MGNLTKRERRLKREAKAERKVQQSNNLLAYLGNYGEIESIQPASAAAFDSQLKNFSLFLATKIAAASAGAVLDIGCGEGILLKRLIEIDSFNTNVSVPQSPS